MADRPFHPDDRREPAENCYLAVCAQVEALAEARESKSEGALDAAFNAIHAGAKRVEVRSAWQVLAVELKPAEYRILLRTKTPAVRIVGLLDEY